MINLSLTEEEADTILNSLHDRLERLPAYFPLPDAIDVYDAVSLTYHTVNDMVRQQRRKVS